MSSRKSLSYDILKYTLLSVIMVSAIGAGAGKAEAGSTSWRYSQVTYNASSNKSTYAPGEWVSVSGSGALDPGATNVAVGIAVYDFNGSGVHICDAGTWCSGGASFPAPSTPGTYSLQFVGSWLSNSYLSYGSFNITVACPSSAPVWNGSTCTAPLVNGTCGSTYQACSSGTLGASAIYQYDASPQAQWWCMGANGGTSNLCVEYSTCGPANQKTYDYTVSSYPDAQCPSGAVSDNTNFPLPGGSVAWLCQRQDSSGLYSRMCQVWRGTAPAPTVAPSCPADTPYTDSNQAAIANYCQANGITCGTGYTYNNLTCHTGGIGTWSSFGPSCTAPYCTGCGCTAIPTPSATSCSAVGTRSWGAGCSAYLNLTGSTAVQNNQSTTIVNTASGYTTNGSSYETWSCSNGGWVGPSSSVCIANAVPVTPTCSSTTLSGCSLPSSTCSAGYTGSCNYSCNSSGAWVMNWNSCTPPVVVSGTPTGTLTPSSSSCSITTGHNSCTQTLSWTTTNPVGTSAVTSPTGTPSPANGNNSSQSFTVPYNPSGVNFFLYNNAVQLAMATVYPSCASGTAWDAASGTCSSSVATPTCPSTTISGCSVPSSTCSIGYSGTCNYSCNSGSWTTNWNSCTASVTPAPTPCPTTTISGCDLSDGSSGSCSAGYVGTCNYSCNSGTWSGNSNSCTIPLPLPTVSLTASPSTINSGQTATLTWTSNNSATRCDSADFSTGGLADNSSPGVTVSPTANKTYSIYCTNATGAGPQSVVSVTVLHPDASIRLSDTRVSKGSSVTVDWSITDTSNCTITKTLGIIGGKTSNWKSNLSSPGLGSDTITTRTTYTINCPFVASKSVVVNSGTYLKEF